MERATIVLASRNRHKFEEISRVLSPLGITLRFGGDLSPLDVAETGKDYVENALLKARAWAETTGLPALADDSGLEVEGLGWRPGIHSARVAESDEARIAWLLESLKEGDSRRARFVAVLVLALPGKKEFMEFTGICQGRIAEATGGVSGFGYDPVFVPDGFDRTFAELGAEIKGKISHRSRAIDSFCRRIQEPSVVKYLLDCSRPEA